MVDHSKLAEQLIKKKIVEQDWETVFVLLHVIYRYILSCAVCFIQARLNVTATAALWPQSVLSAQSVWFRSCSWLISTSMRSISTSHEMATKHSHRPFLCSCGIWMALTTRLPPSLFAVHVRKQYDRHSERTSPADEWNVNMRQVHHLLHAHIAYFCVTSASMTSPCPEMLLFFFLHGFSKYWNECTNTNVWHIVSFCTSQVSHRIAFIVEHQVWLRSHCISKRIACDNACNCSHSTQICIMQSPNAQMHTCSGSS